MTASYVFAVDLRLAATDEAVRIDPATAETTVTVHREAPEPGTDGWLFFRNWLWRGEIDDDEHARRLAEGWLPGAVESVRFRELRLDEDHFAALKEAIATDLEAFNAESVDEVLSKYLGSSVHVTDDA